MDKITQNKNLRLKYNKFEFKNLIIKSLLREKELTTKYKLYLQIKLHKLNLKNSRSKITNYCVISKKSRSINRKFSVDRFTFKNLCSNGIINGLEKTGW